MGRQRRLTLRQEIENYGESQARSRIRNRYLANTPQGFAHPVYPVKFRQTTYLCTCGRYPEAAECLKAAETAFNTAWEESQQLKQQVKVQLLGGPEPITFPASNNACEACSLVIEKTNTMQTAYARVRGENEALKRLLAASKQTPVLAVAQTRAIGPPEKVIVYAQGTCHVEMQSGRTSADMLYPLTVGL